MAYRKYAGYSNATNTQSTTNPMYAIIGAATFRLRVYDWLSGSDATPTDNATKLAFQRSATTIGTTSSTCAIQPLDPADPTSLATYISGWNTTFPQMQTNQFVLQVAQNQRATFRWVAAPDGELVVPATANAGLGLMTAQASGNANYAWTTHWIE